MLFISSQVVHPACLWGLPRRSVETIFLYESAASSLAEPMPTAVASMSKMFVVWIAPWVIVQDGSQKVDSSYNGVPAGILRNSRRSELNACRTGDGISGVRELTGLVSRRGLSTLCH